MHTDTNNSSNSTGSSASGFEQSLGELSLKRSRPPPLPSPQSRPLRTVTSSPQLLPLKQIHEESEITSDEDALSTHSQTSFMKQRHSSLSMASPELARRILVRSYPSVFYSGLTYCLCVNVKFYS